MKICYFSYCFPFQPKACIPTSEDLLETKQALFKHFPCGSAGILQSVLLKRKNKKINHSWWVYFRILDSDSEGNLCGLTVMQTLSSCCLSHTRLFYPGLTL